MTLDGRQRRALRALGHHLRPVVQIGQAGITGAVVEALDAALATHELIKVKVLEAAPIERREAGDALAAETHSEVAQVLGRTVLLFRRNPRDPRVVLPGEPPLAAKRAGGEGDRPAAKARKGEVGQGAAPKRKPGKGKERRGTGAKLPPRRHGR